MIDDSITKPISASSLSEDFETLISLENPTRALEIITFEHQFLLGREEKHGSLSQAIGSIDRLKLTNEYQEALACLLRQVRNYSLESHKEISKRDYMAIIHDLGVVKNTLDEHILGHRKIFLAMTQDYQGLCERNIGHRQKAIKYLMQARENADEKWVGLYIDFNLGREEIKKGRKDCCDSLVKLGIERLVKATDTRKKIMTDQADRYADGDIHLFSEYAWAVKNAIIAIEKNSMYYRDDNRLKCLKDEQKIILEKRH